MGAYFAKSLLDPLNVSANQTTIAKIETKQEKAPEAIIKTSEGIDAYDRKDTEEVKQKLEEAKSIDPTNDVAAEYLAKLTVNTAKFKTLPEPYYSDQNPAYLGIMRTDRLYVSSSWPLILLLTLGASQPPMFELPGGERIWDWDFRVKFGYSFPVSTNFGFDVTVVWYGSDRTASDICYNSGLGGMLNAGFKISDSVSLGLGSTIYAESNRGGIPFGYTPDVHLAVAFDGGIVIRNADETLVYDALLGYCTGKIAFYDSWDNLIRSVNMPLFIENTFTFALNQKNTFIILKQLNDIALDRAFYHGRIIPAFEQFIADWFSLRLALEGSLVLADGAVNFGYGFMGGITFRIIPWGLDIDINVVYRLRPSKVYEDVMFPDLIGTISISLNDLFISRGK